MATPMIPVPGDGGPGPVPLAAPPARIRPGRIWYLVAVLALLGGVAVLLFGLRSLSSRVDSFPRVAIPAGGQVSLSHPGGYVIYYEGPGASNASFHIDMTALSGSAAIGSLTRYSGGSITYQFGSHGGSAIAVVQIARPGRFLVRFTSSSLPAGGHLAFGPSIAGWIAATVIPSLVLVLAGIGGVIAVAIIRHTRARRAPPPLPS